MNRALPYLHGGLLEIMFRLFLKRPRKNNTDYFESTKKKFSIFKLRLKICENKFHLKSSHLIKLDLSYLKDSCKVIEYIRG